MERVEALVVKVDQDLNSMLIRVALAPSWRQHLAPLAALQSSLSHRIIFHTFVLMMIPTPCSERAALQRARMLATAQSQLVTDDDCKKKFGDFCYSNDTPLPTAKCSE